MNALRRPLPHLGPLLALWLLLFQSFAAIHSVKHEVLSPGTQSSCEICVAAHGLGAAPAVFAAPLPAVTAAEPSASPRRFDLPFRPYSRPQTRGPPLFLV